jgi:hypothetical protein
MGTCPTAVAEEVFTDIVRGAETEAAANYSLAKEDERLLDAIQKGCFQYLWNEVDPVSGLVKDRRENPVGSIAGVGFQLSSLPIGVERGWITEAQGRERAVRVLKTLLGRTDNRKFGVMVHFVDLRTGGILPRRRSESVSTIDHALLLAGALPAAEYFGEEIAQLVDQFLAETNWKAFDVSPRGLINFGWRFEGPDLNGPGGFSKFDWHLASDEERLIYFMACGSPREEHAGDPADYYRLARNIEQHGDMEPFVVSWNGSMFTYFFAHCWIDYRRLEADEPRQFGVDNPRVDWFENSRRATLTHRARCVEAADRFKTLAEDRWGFAPCTARNSAGRNTYIVQSLEPNIENADNWEGGTVAPYAAGTAIMFTPAESLAALRAFRDLKGNDGRPLAWRDPEVGGYGFADSFNVDQQYASDDNVAIDVGPMLLAIENVRTGLIWRLFMQHEASQRSMRALKLRALKVDDERN